MTATTYSHKLGMTVGHLLSFLGILVILIGWIITSAVGQSNIRADQDKIRTEMNSLKIQTDLKINELERGRANNFAAIEKLGKENRDDHIILNDKLDNLIMYLKKN